MVYPQIFSKSFLYAYKVLIPWVIRNLKADFLNLSSTGIVTFVFGYFIRYGPSNSTLMSLEILY